MFSTWAGSHDPLVELRDVGVQPIQRHVLLGERADEVVKRHTRDGEDRLPVECGVVEAVQEMDPARARRREADTQPAREFGVAARHQRRRFLVANLDEAHLVAALAQRLHDAVDAVAGEAEDDLDAPVLNRFDQDVGCCQCHVTFSPAPNRSSALSAMPLRSIRKSRADPSTPAATRGKLRKRWRAARAVRGGRRFTREAR